MRLTGGILRTSQAVLCALSFFQLDGFAVPAPAWVMQSVGTPRAKRKLQLKIEVETSKISGGKKE